jgi:hypothetical protein
MKTKQPEREITTERKKWIKTIVELVEDKSFPARRNITDYLVLLLPYAEQKEAEEYVESLYKTYDQTN